MVPSVLTESGLSSRPRKCTRQSGSNPLPVNVTCIPSDAGFGVAANSDGSTSTDAGLLVCPPGISTRTSCHPLLITGTVANSVVSERNVVVDAMPPMLTDAVEA